MSEISDAIQAKCLAFGDRIIKLNDYFDDKQYQSIYADCEELVKLLVHRCKKIDEQLREDK